MCSLASGSLAFRLQRFPTPTRQHGILLVIIVIGAEDTTETVLRMSRRSIRALLRRTAAEKAGQARLQALRGAAHSAHCMPDMRAVATRDAGASSSHPDDCSIRPVGRRASHLRHFLAGLRLGRSRAYYEQPPCAPDRTMDGLESGCSSRSGRPRRSCSDRRQALHRRDIDQALRAWAAVATSGGERSGVEAQIYNRHGLWDRH